MSLHQKIKSDITAALRAKDSLRLETLRGLNALFQNEMLASSANSGNEFLTDDKALLLIKRSVKQRKDSIEQFDKGGRKDLADKERAELLILNEYMPASMSRQDIKAIVSKKIAELKSSGSFDPKSVGLPTGQAGKITGMLMKEFAGKADGADVKAVVEDILDK